MADFLNSLPLIESFGLLGIFIVVFAESGLFFGFFLPGDSLLFTAGLLASEGRFDITALMIGTFIAAVAGDSVGYAFGKKIGPAIYKKKDTLFFKQKYVEQTKVFFARHGKGTIVLARFTPIVRSFAPIMAGVGEMNYADFLKYNILGGALWTIGLSGLGYLLGQTVPNIDHYLLPIIGLIIFISFLPPLIHYLRERRKPTTI